MNFLLRALKVGFKFRLDKLLPREGAPWWLRAILRLLSFLPEPQEPDGERLKNALLSLGPVYIKFGQLISTRRDLFSDEVTDALATLQDSVPPIPDFDIHTFVNTALDTEWQVHFEHIDTEAHAAASIAQIHTATLKTGEAVVLKVVRDGLEDSIRQDMAELRQMAQWVDQRLPEADRFHLPRLARDHETVLVAELNMYAEARNQIQLRRNFADSDLLYVPRVYDEFTRQNLLVMERIHGIPINQVDALVEAGVDLKVLAHKGVETFFRQVFEDNFFHADMHPGNIYIDITNPANPKYIALDCAIIGSLSEVDQNYLAQKLVAFFKRDYHRVADLFFESGWIPADADPDEFVAVMREVCDPIFAKPLAEISFADFVVELFRAAGQFHMEMQPQLALLQKTLLYVEGLGRQLYPQLDLWETAQPFIERWVAKRLNPIDDLVEYFSRGPAAWQDLIALPVNQARIRDDMRIMHATLASQTRVLSKIDAQVTRSNRRALTKRVAGGAFVALGALLLWQPLAGMIEAGDISLLAGIVSAFLGSALIARA